jgi:hypothetical protein
VCEGRSGPARSVGQEALPPYPSIVTLPPTLLALGLVLGLLVLVPARRLRLAGISARAVGTYAAILWLLAFVAAAMPGAMRALVPILLIAYLAPFVAAGGRLGRIVRRGGGPGARPMKDVTPPRRDDDGR